MAASRGRGSVFPWVCDGASVACIYVNTLNSESKRRNIGKAFRKRKSDVLGVCEILVSGCGRRQCETDERKGRGLWEGLGRTVQAGIVKGKEKGMQY